MRSSDAVLQQHVYSRAVSSAFWRQLVWVSNFDTRCITFYSCGFCASHTERIQLPCAVSSHFKPARDEKGLQLIDQSPEQNWVFRGENGKYLVISHFPSEEFVFFFVWSGWNKTKHVSIVSLSVARWDNAVVIAFATRWNSCEVLEFTPLPTVVTLPRKITSS